MFITLYWLVTNYLFPSKPHHQVFGTFYVWFLFYYIKLWVFLSCFCLWFLFFFNCHDYFWYFLIRLRGAQVFGKTLFLDVPMGVFSEDINIWFSTFSKDAYFIQFIAGLDRIKKQIESKLLELRHQSSVPEHYNCWCLSLHIQGLTPIPVPTSHSQTFSLRLCVISLFQILKDLIPPKCTGLHHCFDFYSNL